MVCSLRWHRKNGGRGFSLPPLRLCCVDQFAIYNFHSLISDVVHPADPLHRIGGFQLLCDSFHLSHLLYQPREHFLRLTVDVSKVAVQLSAGEQGRIGCPAMLLQVTPVALSPHADGLLLFFGQLQIREKPRPAWMCRRFPPLSSLPVSVPTFQHVYFCALCAGFAFAAAPYLLPVQSDYRSADCQGPSAGSGNPSIRSVGIHFLL